MSRLVKYRARVSKRPQFLPWTAVCGCGLRISCPSHDAVIRCISRHFRDHAGGAR